jgi:hypothetical protein
MNMVNMALSLNGPAHYITLGPLSISYGNATVILVIFVLFVAAIALPFPSHHDSE